ncbi:hypothetical protein GCM10009544_14020 [Streptomyces stramineus]|uniref:Uncharacterized protein n=1 Tax=Streptomyces stramineus TaxID=173861 RepID=A0ABN0ZM59_9ACTN
MCEPGEVVAPEALPQFGGFYEREGEDAPWLRNNGHRVSLSAGRVIRSGGQACPS